MVRAICIVGDAASGKTSTARELVRRLPEWRFVSTGERFRLFCAENNIAPAEIPSLPDAQHLAADEVMKRLLLTDVHIVAEGRLVGYLATGMPDVLRVFVDASLDVRTRRYAQREQLSEEEARHFITQRDGADLEKFRRLYKIDYHDHRFYDLVVNNESRTIEEVADVILQRACE